MARGRGRHLFQAAIPGPIRFLHLQTVAPVICSFLASAPLLKPLIVAENDASLH
jgi:hypothetical protein